jgi:hypothetical protein
VADVVESHRRATSLSAIILLFIPMRLHEAPERLGEGDDRGGNNDPESMVCFDGV